MMEKITENIEVALIFTCGLLGIIIQKDFRFYAEIVIG